MYLCIVVSQLLSLSTNLDLNLGTASSRAAPSFTASTRLLISASAFLAAALALSAAPTLTAASPTLSGSAAAICSVQGKSEFESTKPVSERLLNC